MPLPFSFGEVSRRLDDVRSWAADVTDGNRCAMVLGLALNVRPNGSQETMRGQPFVKESVRDQPFSEKFFVKAWDVTETVMKRWGPPAMRVPGISAGRQLAGKRGFVFLEDCWRTPSEKLNKALFGVDVKSGDHVDLWDGATLSIYPAPAKSAALLRQSRMVWLWEFKS